MTATLVFVHGRGQEFKDPAKMLESWRAGLATGLAEGGHPVPSGTPVLPFYGNLLFRITAELERSAIDLESLPADPDDPGPLHPALSEEIGTIEGEMLLDMVTAASGSQADEQENLFRRAGQRILAWKAARQALMIVAEHGRVDREVIKSQLRDVAVYLGDKNAREQILGTVRAGLPADGPLVLVTHSLGTVVARDLLDDPGVRQRTRGWLTCGSPLGLPAVQRNLQTRPFRNPGVDWLSAYDVRDVVALGHPLRPSWKDPLADLAVDNGDAPHSIERYLAHREVADFVHRTVTG